MKARLLGVLTISLGLDTLACQRVQRAPPTREALETVADPAEWGAIFAPQYASYAQPDFAVPRERLDEDPRLARLYAGSAYERSLKSTRDHAHALEDVKATARLTPSTKAMCLTCKSASYRGIVGAPPDDAEAEAEFSARLFSDVVAEADAPVACLDCHDPLAMDTERKLRVSRPAFLRATPGAVSAPQGALRSYVCGQCHSEYYARPVVLADGREGSIVEHPTARGVRIEDIIAFYDAIAHSDFIHPVSGAPLLKLQHPQYELWSQGPHGASQVSCTHCHMPSTDAGHSHSVAAATAKIETTCGSCHKKRDAKTARADISAIQAGIDARLSSVADQLVEAHAQTGALRARRGDAAALDAQRVLRAAQARWDFIASENSRGFHAPAESTRILDDAARLLSELLLSLAHEGGSP